MQEIRFRIATNSYYCVCSSSAAWWWKNLLYICIRNNTLQSFIGLPFVCHRILLCASADKFYRWKLDTLCGRKNTKRHRARRKVWQFWLGMSIIFYSMRISVCFSPIHPAREFNNIVELFLFDSQECVLLNLERVMINHYKFFNHTC